MTKYYTDTVNEYLNLATTIGMFKHKKTRGRYDKDVARTHLQGRNELCKCLSGKKFKNCCGR